MKRTELEVGAHLAFQRGKATLWLDEVVVLSTTPHAVSQWTYEIRETTSGSGVLVKNANSGAKQVVQLSQLKGDFKTVSAQREVEREARIVQRDREEAAWERRNSSADKLSKVINANFTGFTHSSKRLNELPVEVTKLLTQLLEAHFEG